MTAVITPSPPPLGLPPPPPPPCRCWLLQLWWCSATVFKLHLKGVSASPQHPISPCKRVQEDPGRLQPFLQSARLGLDFHLGLHDLRHHDPGQHQDLALWIEETAANYHGPLVPSCRG